VKGLDLSPALSEVARRGHGLDVQCADVLDAAVLPHSLNAVLMFGTISSLQGLEQRLARMRHWLKPDGLLVFNFPDAGSLIARFYGSRFWMFSPTADTFMSARGCCALLRACGFEPALTLTDRQRPSLQKLFKHARLTPALRLAAALNLANKSLPFSLPIPVVKLVMARPASR